MIARDGVPIRFAETDADVERCFPVIVQLRPALDLEGYLAVVRRQREEGVRIAFAESEGEVVCVAHVRLLTAMATGRTLYVEDLVTDGERRSRGFGAEMLRWLTEFARGEGCRTLSLESGTQRREAHAFYFRHGLRVTDFHFQMEL